MSDNKYNPTRKSNAQKVRDDNFVADAKFHLKRKFLGTLTPVEQLLEKTKDVTTKLRQTLKPVVAAGGWKDKAALHQMILTMYLESFDTTQLFTREDLVQICAILHTEVMMQTIEDDPTLSGTPDLLSGS